MNTTDDKKRILVVDDERFITFMLSSLFKWAKIEVESINVSTEALGKLEAVRFDLIVTDYMMPVLNGLDLIKKIRAHDNPDVMGIEALMLTAKKLDETEMNSLLENKVRYLKKPFVPNDLKQIVMQILGV